MSWTTQQIINAIEAHHWDYEPTFQIPGFTELRDPHLLAWKVATSNNPYTNRVMRADFSDQDAEGEIDRVLNFYGDKKHSWWLGPTSRPTNLQERLEKRGLQPADEYIGLALPIANWQGIDPNPDYDTLEVTTDEHIWHHVHLSAKVWDMDERSQQSAFRERQIYLNLPDRRGGYVVVLKDGLPVGNGSYRFSHDGKTLYLTGSAVLPEYRGHGIYHLLLDHRFRLAASRNAEYATTQARVGTSEPILRKLGFEEYGKYVFMKKE